MAVNVKIHLQVRRSVSISVTEWLWIDTLPTAVIHLYALCVLCGEKSREHTTGLILQTILRRSRMRLQTLTSRQQRRGAPQGVGALLRDHDQAGALLKVVHPQR